METNNKKVYAIVERDYMDNPHLGSNPRVRILHYVFKTKEEAQEEIKKLNALWKWVDREIEELQIK